MILSSSKSLHYIADQTGVSYSTCHRLHGANATGSIILLETFLEPGTNRAGAKSNLTVQQENNIVERLLVGAKRGFAGGETDLQSIMAQEAYINGKPYKMLSHAKIPFVSFGGAIQNSHLDLLRHRM